MTAKQRAKPRTAVQQWNHAVREAYVPPGVGAVLEASDAEIDERLRAAGFDLDAVHAKADATFEAALARFG